MKYWWNIPLASAGLIMASPLLAQKDETIRLSEALFFECMLSTADQSQAQAKFGVTYLEYVDRPGRPQINFADPSALIMSGSGWAPKGVFALSRLTENKSLFVWYGKQAEDGFPIIHAAIEILPLSDGSMKSRLNMKHFSSSNGSDDSVKEFAGECDVLTGEAAYYRFSEGGPL